MAGHSPGRFTSGQAREKFLAAYDRAFAELWPCPRQESDIETSYGTTHIHRCGPAEGEPVVLLHGAGSSAIEWYRHVADLGRGHPVFAPDIPGYAGRSIQTAPMRTPAASAAWLDETLRAVGTGPAHLVGSSYGGWLALNQALRSPGQVASITLLDPAGLQKVSLRFWWWLAINGLALLAPPFTRKRLAAWLASPVLAEPALREVLVTGFRAYRPEQHVPTPLTGAELRSITVPALLLVGEHSPLLHPATALARARLIPGAEAEIVPGTGHGPAFEHPGYANPRITAFLAAPGKDTQGPRPAGDPETMAGDTGPVSGGRTGR